MRRYRAATNRRESQMLLERALVGFPQFVPQVLLRTTEFVQTSIGYQSV